MLHLVNKSPFERNALESCLRLATADAPILLLEDGIYAAMQNTAWADKVKAATSGRKIYVLGPDLKARGIAEDRLIDGISVVDYDGFVDLVVDQGPTQSWL